MGCNNLGEFLILREIRPYKRQNFPLVYMTQSNEVKLHGQLKSEHDDEIMREMKCFRRWNFYHIQKNEQTMLLE